jgi:hypothetical protein
MLFYLCWVAVNIPFCLLRFYKHSPSALSALRLMYQLLKDAEDKEEVTREDFEALVIRNDYF